MTAATRRRAHRLDLDAMALATGVALGIGAFAGAVSIVINMLCGG